MLLAIVFVMALTADTRIALAAPGGAEQVAAPPVAGETPFDRQGTWIEQSAQLTLKRKRTRTAVRAFQASAGLRVDGMIGTTTWGSLLNFDPVRPRWAGRRAKRAGGATASRAFPPRRPLSASLPAKAYEIDPGPAP